MPFDLNLLPVFDALMAERNVTRAGERLGMSQPAVSGALSRLRDVFSDELFLRAHGGMVPTARAHALVEPVRQALARIDTLMGAGLPFDPATSTRQFTIAAADYFAHLLPAALLRRLAIEAPSVVVHFVDNAAGDVAPLLEGGQADLVLDHGTTQPDCIRFGVLAHETLTLVAAASHPRLAAAGLVPGTALPLDLYCQLQHTLRSSGRQHSGIVDRFLAATGRERCIPLTLGTFAAVAQLVSASELVAALPTSLVPLLARSYPLVQYELPCELSRSDHMLLSYWHQRDDTDAGNCWLRETVGAVLLEVLACGRIAAGTPSQASADFTNKVDAPA